MNDELLDNTSRDRGMDVDNLDAAHSFKQTLGHCILTSSGGATSHHALIFDAFLAIRTLSKFTTPGTSL